MKEPELEAFEALSLEEGPGTLADRWRRVDAAHRALYLEFWRRLERAPDLSAQLSARVMFGRLALETERKVAPVRAELSKLAGEFREVTTPGGFALLAADYFQNALRDADGQGVWNDDLAFARGWLARFRRG